MDRAFDSEEVQVHRLLKLYSLQKRPYVHFTDETTKAQTERITWPRLLYKPKVETGNIIWFWGLLSATSWPQAASQAEVLQRTQVSLWRTPVPGKDLPWLMTDRDSPGFLLFSANIYFWTVDLSTTFADSIHLFPASSQNGRNYLT